MSARRTRTGRRARTPRCSATARNTGMSGSPSPPSAGSAALPRMAAKADRPSAAASSSRSTRSRSRLISSAASRASAAGRASRQARLKAASPSRHAGSAKASAGSTGSIVPPLPVSQASAGSGTRPERGSSPRNSHDPPVTRAHTGPPRAARTASAVGRSGAIPGDSARSARGRGVSDRARPDATARAHRSVARGIIRATPRVSVGPDRSSGVSRVPAPPTASSVAPRSSTPTPHSSPPAGIVPM